MEYGGHVAANVAVRVAYAVVADVRLQLQHRVHVREQLRAPLLLGVRLLLAIPVRSAHLPLYFGCSCTADEWLAHSP